MPSDMPDFTDVQRRAHAAHSIYIQRKQGNLTKSRKSRQEMFSREKKGE